MKKVPIENLNYEYDEEINADLSHKRIDLLSRNWNGFVFYAVSFSQEIPDSHIFPDDMTGATFINCNLDNVFIPEGNMVIGGRQNRFKAQNDGNDWEIDETDKPVRPVNHKAFIKLGLEVPKPEDIPTEKVEKPLNLIKLAEEKKVLSAEITLQ